MKTSRTGHRVRWLLTTCLLTSALLPPPAKGQLGVRWVLNEVNADFAVPDGYPLIKSKFNLYDPVGPSMDQFDQNVGLMSELNVETYRLELAWGRARNSMGIHTVVGGTLDALTYDFTPLDHIVDQLSDQGVALLAAYGYTPTPLQDTRIDRSPETAPPVSLDRWTEVAETVAEHYRNVGIPFVHEVWNEPDGRSVFFSGSESDYQRMFAAAVKGIRAANPDAVISGPALAPGLYWGRSFPEFVAEHEVPLDYLSYHAYGSGELAVEYTDSMSVSLSRFPSLVTTGLSLDEWHHADCCNWCLNDARQTYEGASQLLHDFMLLLQRPALTSVSWAWFMDPGRGNTGCMGLVNASGQRKAVFNAWKLYAGLPVDRRKVHVRGPLEAVASSDSHKAGLLIWNRDPYDRWLTNVRLENVPFSKGDVRVYRIDSEHASVGDGAEEELAPVETFGDVFFDEATWTWSGAIPRGGVLYFEAMDRTGLSELTPIQVGKVIRVNRYFPARGQTDSYADFDRKTWVARLGMMGDPAADQRIGVLAEGLPDAVQVAVDIDGDIAAAAGRGTLALRVDYRVDGSFVKSMLYQGPWDGAVLDADVGPMPWDLTETVDDVVSVTNLSSFRVALAQDAPAGWEGAAHFAFVLRNAGEGVRAKFTVRPAGPGPRPG